MSEKNNWWVESDFIYMNNIFEGAGLIERIAELASTMKAGTWFVTLFKAMPVDPLVWEIKLCKYMEMSWGNAPVHVHYKLL